MHKQFDVVIVGAGIAGCHLAANLLANGFSILLIDQKDLMTSGPNWINAVPFWIFDEVKLSPLLEKEIFDINDRFILKAKKNKLIINKLGLLDINMSNLGHRLKKNIIKYGEHNFLKGCVKHSIYENNRLTTIHVDSEDKTVKKIKATLFVDASGIKAVLRKQHPMAKLLWPLLAREDTCIAAQISYEIKDRYGALSYLENNKINTKDILAEIGFMGGYSLFRSQIDDNLNHISLLCGVRALPNHESALNIISKFRNKNSWIGSSFIKGFGAIPLHAPYENFGASGLALLGDAAQHIYAAHGSGIGMGLLAATILGEVLYEASKANMDLGSVSIIKNYQHIFNQKYRKRLYFSFKFRKLSQELSINNMDILLKALPENLIRQTLQQGF